MTLAYDLPVVMDCGGLTQTFKKTWELIRDFGYGSENVTVYPCWDSNSPLKVLPPDTKCVLYLNPQKHEAIIVVSDFSRGGKTIVDISGLGFKPMAVTDLETKKSLEVNGNKLEIELKKHDFKIIILKERE